MDFKPIETEYAGCRFRSRLEARWAVFFDALGIPWRYEDQGYDLPSGRYLPDFVIQACALGNNNGEIWAEVKGMLDVPQAVRLVRAALELPPMSAGPMFPQMLVLGDIPRPGHAWAHTRIDIGSEMFAARGVVFQAGEFPRLVPVDETVPMRVKWLDHILANPEVESTFPDLLLQATVADWVLVDPDVDNAYRAARSARFEFGQTPRGGANF